MSDCPPAVRSLLILTVGLPRSGKTTWARAWWRETASPIVSPDAIRLALHGQRFQALAEPFVWAIAKVMVRALFAAGHGEVIVDATNTTRKRRDEWRDPAWEVWFHEMGVSAADCRARARAMGDEDIIATIDRMEAAFEPITDEERGATLPNNPPNTGRDAASGDEPKSATARELPLLGSNQDSPDPEAGTTGDRVG